MPLPLTVSCFSKIQIGFTFLVPAHPGSPGQRAVKRVCVCVCCIAGAFIVVPSGQLIATQCDKNWKILLERNVAAAFFCWCPLVLFCSLAVLDPRVGHTMDVLSPFIPVLCHSDWLFQRESCPCLDVVHPGRAWSSSPTCTWLAHCIISFSRQLPCPLVHLD